MLPPHAPALDWEKAMALVVELKTAAGELTMLREGLGKLLKGESP
jgi:hypothetical protein